ncbi:MAG: PEP-utilizing enzyme [Spirochaetota bacterium]
MDSSKVLAQFLGDENFPVEWESEKEKGLFWFFDDNHCPFPVSPMYFSMDGWWGPSCEYLFERFDIPTGKSWEAKRINGYVYTAIEPRENEKEEQETGNYFNWIMPTYATHFLDWWRERYLPETLSNFEYIDNFDYENATLAELMIYLEEAKDIQLRHFKLHWVLNWAQFTASMTFNGLVNELIGDVDADLLGKVNVSREDRNWDSLKALWQLKEEIKQDKELKKIFDESDEPAEIEKKLQQSAAGKKLIDDVYEYAKEFGYKAIYTHEYVFPLIIEDQKPVYEQLKGYLASDFDYNVVYDNCIKEQEDAIAYLRDKLKDASDEDKKRFEEALDLNLRMLPLTPDHHFYFDQGTYARMRLVLLRVARKMVELGQLDDPEDIMYLEYEQLRRYVADPENYPGRKLIADAKAEIKKAEKIVPRDWVGTVTQKNMYEEPYHTLWGYPEKFEREMKGEKVEGTIEGLPASPGSTEGIARVVKSSAEFDKVKQGDIMVCIMTNPAWVVVFSKISAIVTDSGGVLSHSAVVAREFMMPAVVGTGSATREIESGDRIRVDGDNGVVTILEKNAD